jgi:methyl-accepting chemotaxis protein
MAIVKGIKGKLLLIVMGALLLLGITSLLTTSRLNSNINEYDEMIHVVLEAQTKALSANLEFKRQVQEWKNTLIRGADAEQMEKYWGRFNSRHDTTQGHVNELIPLLSGFPELEAVAFQFLNDHNTMKSAYADGRDQYIAAKFDIAVGDKAVSGIDRAPSAALDDLVAKLDEFAMSQISLVETSAHKNVRLSFILTLLIVVVVAAIAFVTIDKIIVSPLYSVRKSIAAVARGDLTVSSKYHSSDEIGDIAESARELQSFLHNNVETMKSTSSSLMTAANHMEGMSVELNKQSGNQMQATEQVATAIQELTHSASEVATNSQQTSEITQETQAKTTESSNTGLHAQSRSESLVSDLTAGAQVIQELAENAANVSSVLDVIRGIAEQTNLLALNAAIEAARAGEQGRGFAVVADEVRTLAQRTQDSTAEIERILDSVKSGADKAVVAMDGGQARSQEVKDEITQSTTLMAEIASMVDEINVKNVQIATASSEQTDVANSVSELIQNIHTLSESTSGQVEQTQQVSVELKQLVSEFDSQISRFTL